MNGLVVAVLSSEESTRGGEGVDLRMRTWHTVLFMRIALQYLFIVFILNKSNMLNLTEE